MNVVSKKYQPQGAPRLNLREKVEKQSCFFPDADYLGLFMRDWEGVDLSLLMQMEMPSSPHSGRSDIERVKE